MNILSRDGSQIVTLTEAKNNSRVTSSTEDTIFQTWIDVAHEKVEQCTNLVLNQSTCEQIFYEKEVNLHAPVRGVVSVTCYDSDNVATVTTDYTLKKTHDYGLSLILDSKPSNYAVIKYKAGYGAYTATGSEVAINEGTIEARKQAIYAVLLLTNHYYENRGIVTDFNKYKLPFGIQSTLDDLTKYL